MCFWYQAGHPGAVAMGGGALLMSMEGGVASFAEDPEWAVFARIIWSLVVAFETIGVGVARAFL